MTDLSRAWQLYEFGRFESAIRVCRDALLSAPLDAEATSLLAFCYSNIGKHSEGLKAASDAVSLGPQMPLAWSALTTVHLVQGDLAAAREAGLEWLKAAPNSADALRTLALICFAENDNAGATRFLDQALEIDPNFADAKLLKAGLLSNAGQHNEALEVVHAGLKDSPESDIGHTTKALIHLEEHKPRFAVLAFSEALRINPENRAAKEGLREALRRLVPPYRWLTGRWALHPRSQPQKWAGLVTLLLISLLLAAVIFRFAPVKLASAIGLLPLWLFQASEVVANACLLFHPLGRRALTAVEKVEATPL